MEANNSHGPTVEPCKQSFENSPVIFLCSLFHIEKSTLESVHKFLSSNSPASVQLSSQKLFFASHNSLFLQTWIHSWQELSQQLAVVPFETQITESSWMRHFSISDAQLGHRCSVLFIKGGQQKSHEVSNQTHCITEINEWDKCLLPEALLSLFQGSILSQRLRK